MKGVTFAIALVLAASAASCGLLAYRYSQIDRIVLPDGTLEDEADDEPQNFLIIGSDSRAFVEVDQEAESYGTAAAVGAPKADTILVARTFPDSQRLALVSFPRDLWVNVAGTGRRDRINAAIGDGVGDDSGSARLVETIGAEFGIPIHHVVQVDFRGFKGLVNAVGGVKVYFASPVRDWDREQNVSPTGLDIREPGCVRLDGDAALAYVRSRHYERLIDGHWAIDPTGDLNRIARQQDFIRRTLRQALSRGFGDPRRLDRVARSATDFVQIDDSLGATEMVRFGRNFRSMSADALDTYSLPTTPHTTAGGAQVLVLQEEAAKPVLDVFRGTIDEPRVLLPGSVRMNVVDSAGKSGQLQAASFRLAAAGFVVADTGSAAERSGATVIRYGAGQLGKAELLASALVTDARLVEDDAVVGVDLVLLLGRDFEGVKEVVAPSTSAATPTTPPAPPSTPPAPPPSTPATGPSAIPAC